MLLLVDKINVKLSVVSLYYRKKNQVIRKEWLIILLNSEITSTHVQIFFQVLFTTTSFSSVLSCEDLLISHVQIFVWQDTSLMF